jgi:hypothetical protein
MKILVSENQIKKIISELEFKVSAPEQIRNFIPGYGWKVPITYKIGEKLYENNRITAFHVSDIGNINNMKYILNTKKTISAFTTQRSSHRHHNTESIFKGAQTYGGILYKVNGDLLLSSSKDVFSMPDENGIRWIGSRQLISDELHNEFDKNIKNIILKYHPDKNTNIERNSVLDQQHSKDKTNFIKEYFNYIQNFILQHKNEIVNYLNQNDRSLDQEEDWNEVLLSNIEIVEIIWCPHCIFRKNDFIHRGPNEDYVYYIRDNKAEDGRRIEYINEKNYLKFIKQIQQQLQTLTTGKVTMYSGDDKSYEYLHQFIKLL